MAVLYVARSTKLCKWASDVGLGKNLFKVGVADEPLKPLIEAGWAGETDWALLKQQEAGDLTEADVIARLARKEKMIDPNYYPKLRGTQGVYRVTPEQVENHMIVARAMANEAQLGGAKLKPVDFANYLVQAALR